MKKMLLLSICCVAVTAGVMAMERQEQRIGLAGLSPDILRKILSFSAQGASIHGRAKAIIALAGTNRHLKRVLNTGTNMLELVKSLPTKAAGIYLTEKLGGMSGMQSPEVQEWVKNIGLESGEELYKAVLADNPDLEIVRSMISNSNIDLNWKNNKGWTALMEASLNGYTEIVKVLVGAGANVNLQASDGETALMAASDKGHTEVVKQLVEAGANVDLQNVGGLTALMKAAVNGHKEVVQVLVEAGANVNLQDKNGETALMWASARGHREIVQMLVGFGAKGNLPRSNGCHLL